MIERRSKRDQAIARHASIGRHQPDHAAKRRRLANRTARVRTQRRHRHVRSHGRGRPARRTSRNARKIARIVHRLPRRVLVGRTHRKLVAIQLAQHHGAGRFETSDGGAIVRRNIVAQNLRTGRGANALGDHHIFDCDRHAAQRRKLLALCRERVHLGSFGHRPLFRKSQKRADLRIVALDLGVKRLRQRRSAGLALLHGGAGGVNGEQVQIHEIVVGRWSLVVGQRPRANDQRRFFYLSITFGTLKNVPSESGAFASATSWGSDLRKPSWISSRLA